MAEVVIDRLAEPAAGAAGAGLRSRPVLVNFR